MTETVTAIVLQGRTFRMARLAQTPSGFVLLDSRGSDTSGGDFESFCDSLRAGEPASHLSASPHEKIVAGFDGGQVAFYRISVPAVPEDELARLVSLQAESLLPLPLELMQFSWRTRTSQGPKVSVTLAAARTDHLKTFAQRLAYCKPENVYLTSEALVRLWREVYAGGYETAVVIYVDSDATRICVAEKGQLAFSATADLGWQDLQHTDPQWFQRAEQLAQDIRGVQQMSSGAQTGGEGPFILLSDGTDRIERLRDYLAQAGLQVTVAAPSGRLKRQAGECSPAEVYEYAVPVGLALLKLEDDGQELKLFDTVYQGRSTGKSAFPWFSLRWSTAAAAVLAIAYLLMSYGVDLAQVKRFDRYNRQDDSSLTLSELARQYQLRKAVAAQRPDVLDLLQTVNAARPQGLLLDDIAYKRGQPVSLIGTGKNRDEIDAFQESLQQQKDLSVVRLQSYVPNEKDKNVKFTITCEYKNFCTKQNSNLPK